MSNCVLSGNSAAWRGGGASSFSYTVCYGALNNCTITGNSAPAGGGIFGCTLNNYIVWLNTGVNGLNYSGNELCPVALNYCCTTPTPTNGVANINNAPLFVDYADGNLRLQSNSPCINAGNDPYAAGATDLDADGHVAWQEWRCQTDPTNALSALRLVSASPAGTPPGGVTVTWQSVAGVDYFLERSGNLSLPFTPLAPDLPGQPGITSFTDTNATSLTPLFYRVGVR